MITINRATKAIRAAWPGFPAVLQVATPGCIVMRIRPLGPEDKIVVDPCFQQQHVVLAKVLLAQDRSRHPVGYTLLYQTGAILHHATGYCAVCYSQPTDLRFREPSVQFNDEHVRLVRYGADQYDWFLGCRHKTIQQTQANATAQAQRQHVGAWRDGA